MYTGWSRPSLLGRLFEVVHQVGHILVVRVRCGGLRRATLVRFRQLLEVGKVVGAQLVDDARKQILQLCGARADRERGWATASEPKDERTLLAAARAMQLLAESRRSGYHTGSRECGVLLVSACPLTT